LNSFQCGERGVGPLTVESMWGKKYSGGFVQGLEKIWGGGTGKVRGGLTKRPSQIKPKLGKGTLQGSKKKEITYWRRTQFEKVVPSTQNVFERKQEGKKRKA